MRSHISRAAGIVTRVWMQRFVAGPALQATGAVATATQHRYAVMAAIGVWVAFQTAFPARHLLYPGNPRWLVDNPFESIPALRKEELHSQCTSSPGPG